MHRNRSKVRTFIRLFANTIMFACLAAALWGVGAEAFCLTVFFVVWILRIALPVATRWLEADPDTVIYFAPWVSRGDCLSLFKKHPTPGITKLFVIFHRR